MLQDLKAHAIAANRPEWGWGGPHDAGSYNSQAWETGFFVSDSGSWNTEYGRFFLGWYSQCLLDHADRVLGAASKALANKGPRTFKSQAKSGNGETVFTFEPTCALGAKLAGVHWWFNSRAHAAELTAGYYNTRERNGYAPVMQLLARHNARVSFTCVEMRDCEFGDWPDARCSPQGLLEQIIQASMEAGVPLSGENALQRYDHYAFDRIAESAFGRNARAGHLEQLTFLRMGDLMFENFGAFSQFLSRLRTKTYPMLAAEG
jgi:beta-amylase